ncbi:MAG: LuxR family transcriptional regulator [Oricola sp.]
MEWRAGKGQQCESTTIRAIDAIGSARTAYDIFKVLKTHLHDFRLSFFAVFVPSRESRANQPDSVVLTNWDSEVIHRCLEEDPSRWPFAPGQRDSVLPYSVVLEEGSGHDDEHGDRDLVRFLRAGGQEAFVYLPVHSSIGRKGAIVFSGAREQVGVDEVMELAFIARHAFEKLMLILAAADNRANPLSEREIECLKSAARGLSSAETAERLGITCYTVNYHLANALKKLDAHTKTEAVARAIWNGWLDRS